MTPSVYLLDTGPLVAVLNRREAHHAWTVRLLDTLDAPLLTCEAVLSEAWFLIKRDGGDPQNLLALVQLLDIGVRPVWNERILALLKRYATASVLLMPRSWYLPKQMQDAS